MDTGATYSVLIFHSGPTIPLSISVTGVNRSPSFLQRPCHFPASLQGDSSHTLQVIPACPIPLLGHDSLSHFGAKLTLAPTVSPHSHFLLPLIGSHVSSLDCPVPTFSNPVDPMVATYQQPVRVGEIKPGRRGWETFWVAGLWAFLAYPRRCGIGIHAGAR